MKSVQIQSFFWSVFSRIRTEYGEILRISRMQPECEKIRTRKKLRIRSLFMQCHFQNLVTDLSIFSHPNDPLAPVILIFYIFSIGYSIIRLHKTNFPVFFYKKQSLLRQTYDDNFILKICLVITPKMLRTLAFNIFNISCRKTMKPIEPNDLRLFRTLHYTALHFRDDFLYVYWCRLNLVYWVKCKSSPVAVMM